MLNHSRNSGSPKLKGALGPLRSGLKMTENRRFAERSQAGGLLGKSKVHSSLGVIAFLQHAPKKSSASKM